MSSQLDPTLIRKVTDYTQLVGEKRVLNKTIYMLTFIKNKITKKQSTKVETIEPTGPNIIVEQIHSEFNTACDRLLKEAKAILEEAAKANVSKVDRLKALGFGQANEVQKLQPLLEKANLSKEQVDLINYYNQNYPFNKFITEEQVKIICHKYNLICGNVFRYRGFVPEKNLREIENFKLKKQDDTNPKLGEFYIIMDGWSLLNIKDLPKSNFIYNEEKLEQLVTHYLNKHDFTYFGNKSINKCSNIPGWGKIFQYRENNLVDTDIKRAIERNQKSLQICAPVKDMDMADMTIEEGYKMKQLYKDVPDPVVLQPIKGGYLIVTAWGDEASDPIVVNQNHN